MKDRTSKHPGRVKLKPVAGQTDTYDMTRADDPDDTGTPFNTRTMLQDSTGRFLRLPYANPLVDDAFRHMVDRIVPIGTIRTSPAQSLGDAWLKCDGSMVTFENYPQLCSVLRNTGGAVTLDTNAFPPTYTGASIQATSEPVYFDGKWMVAIRDINSWVKILSVSELDGTWVEEASFDADAGYTYSGIWLSASENYCVCAYLTFYSGESGYKLRIKVREIDASEWVEIDPGVGYQYSVSSAYINGMDNCGSKFGILVYVGGSGSFVAYSDTPADADSWSRAGGTSKKYESLSCIGTEWFALSGEKTSGYFTIIVWKADDISLFNFRQLGSYSEPASVPVSLRYSSKVALYSGKYLFMAYVGQSSGAPGGSFYPSVYSTTDFETWEVSEMGNLVIESKVERLHASASNTMLALAGGNRVWTTSDMDAGYSDVSIPDMPVQGLSVKGMTVVAAAKTGIAYHDYTYDSRLLPTISLSDDTTTFIKAKNELDVFESQQSGG